MLERQDSQIVTKLTSDENGNLAFDFPEEIIEILKWEEGDSIGIEVFAGRVIFRKLGSTETSECPN